MVSKWSGYLEDEKYSKAFQMIGLVNYVGESPIYINQKVKDKNYLTVTFNTVGIAIEKWKDKKQEIESALDISISKIKIGNKNTEIIIEGIKGKFDYSMPIYWKNSYLTPRNSLILGVKYGKTNICRFRCISTYLIRRFDRVRENKLIEAVIDAMY